MTPAENPSVRVMNLGPGFRTAIPKKLPIVVESPASADRSRANPMLPTAPPFRSDSCTFPCSMDGDVNQFMMVHANHREHICQLKGRQL